MTDQPEQPKLEDFEAPPEEAAGAEGVFPEMPDASVQAAAAEAVEPLAAVAESPNPLLDAKEAIAELLGERVRPEPTALTIDSHTAEGNIQGVAVGEVNEISSLAIGGAPGAAALKVYVAEPASTDEVRSILVDSLGVKAAGDQVPIEVEVTGIIRQLPHAFRERPAPGGISVGHNALGGSGTLGCLCFGRQEPRNSRVMILSNNHVLGLNNAAAAGDCICQPGPGDSGSCPNDQIAVLESFVPIDFAGPNVVDCATGWAWPDRVRVEQVYLSGGTPTYYRTGNTPVAPVRGMEVGKSGLTTQLRKGRIDAVGGTFTIHDHAGRPMLFQDTIGIRGVSPWGNFSEPGDSGSLIWQWADGTAPVGLLFAGGGDLTFANRIESVMAGLDIWLYT